MLSLTKGSVRYTGCRIQERNHIAGRIVANGSRRAEDQSIPTRQVLIESMMHPMRTSISCDGEVLLRIEYHRKDNDRTIIIDGNRTVR